MRLSALANVVPTGLRGSQRPGLLHLPDGSDAHVDDALYLLGEWGFGYDDWQEFALACALREQPDGRWAAKEFGLELSRQNGKGEIVEGREALGLFYLDERKLIHSAHEFATASEALDRMDDRIGRNPQLKQRVKSVKRSHGEEGVYLKDGRKLLYKTRTKGGGRGFSCDFLALDEAMFIAEAFLGALMPVISARPNPQMWYMGSAVDQATMDHGIVFARLRERALAGDAARMAYLGWSPAYEYDWKTPADVPAGELLSPDVIALANPALGIRIDLEHVVESEYEAMDDRTYCVERLGVGDWPETDPTAGGVINVETWKALTDTGSEAQDPLCLVFDTSPDRLWSSIGVAGYRQDRRAHVEVVDRRPGTDWVAKRVAELVGRHEIAVVLCDGKSPAASLIPALKKLGVKVETVDAGEHAQACGTFVDAVGQDTVRHLGTDELLAAVRGAAKRLLGDAWAWSRKSSAVDISPLVAVTLALWKLESAVEPAGPRVEVFG